MAEAVASPAPSSSPPANSPRSHSDSSSVPPSDREIVGPYLLGPTIGKGIFAKVKLGEDEYRQKVAIKVFDKLLLARSKHQLAQVEKEINAIRVCHHTNIVQFYEVLESNERVYLVMEHLPHGELYDYILDKGRLGEEEGGRLFWQIASAVFHCHQRGICHRDLKPENILLDNQFNVKLVDFGLANYFDIDAEKDAKSLRTQCGSPHYAAPEILTGTRYNGPKADVWSLGILLYAMLCGTLPFNARSIPLLIKKILEGKYKFPKFLSSSARHLISNILQLDAEKRPTVAELMIHPWLAQWSPARTGGHHGSIALSPNKTTPSRPEIISPESLPAHVQRRPAPINNITNNKDDQNNLGNHQLSPRISLPPSSLMAFPAEPAVTSAPTDPALIKSINEKALAEQAARTAAETKGGNVDTLIDNATNAGSPPYSFSLNAATSPTTSPTATVTNTVDTIPIRDRGETGYAKRVCRFCNKNLTMRLNENGNYLLNGETDLCRCGKRDNKNNIINNNTTNSNNNSSDVSSPSAAPGGPTTAGIGYLSDEMSATYYNNSGFELGSFRENYFRPDDKLRKSNLKRLAEGGDAAARLKLLEEKHAEERRKLEEKLIRAAESGDLNTVNSLINAATEVQGVIATFAAGDASSLSESKETLPPPVVDLRARTIDNMTALHLASRQGHVQIVQSLLSSCLPLDINSRTKSGWSSLMLAADRGKIEVCKLLLRYGAAIHITNYDGKSAIFLARESGHTEIAHLLTHASSTRHRRHTAVHGSLSERSLNVEFLRACECGDVSKVRHLLALTQREMESGAAALAAAQAAKSEKQRRSLVIPSRLDPNGFFNREQQQYVIDIYARGIDNWSSLHFAARKGRAAVLELLLSCRPPVEVNALTKNGWTPLLMASDKGHSECVRMLIDAGADPLIKSGDGHSAISVASQNGFDDIVALLTPLIPNASSSPPPSSSLNDTPSPNTEVHSPPPVDPSSESEGENEGNANGGNRPSKLTSLIRRSAVSNNENTPQ